MNTKLTLIPLNLNWSVLTQTSIIHLIIILNGQPVPVVFKDKHLGNYISSSINDRHIIGNIYELYQRSNLLISQFRPCNSETLDRLHITYCMHMYGCELWNLNEKDVDQFKVA